jgi:hypothetical protein
MHESEESKKVRRKFRSCAESINRVEKRVKRNAQQAKQLLWFELNQLRRSAEVRTVHASNRKPQSCSGLRVRKRDLREMDEA